MRLAESSALAADRLDRVREIYEDAFPPTLRAPFADLLVDRVLVLLDSGAPVGFAVLRDLPQTSWTFLRYFAVGPRGGGVGTTMWRLLTARLATEGRTRLLWDLEDPDEPGLSPASVAEHRRRIGFYERLGARLLPVVEYLPPHDDGHAPQLRLMDIALADEPAPTVRDLVETVYLHRYAVPADDPVVRRTLRASRLL